jgi:WD40 repeat protein
VGLRTQVSLAELETALVRLFKPKGRNIPETALFYFSGHGLQKDAGIQEGYLATSDANPAANFYGLSLFWLRRLLQESPVRQRILLLDCCHSGELLNFLEADPGARTGTDRLFMAASREYEVAYESLTGQYSVFTQALLDGLDPNRLPNGCISNYALTDWVSTALKGEQQQPLFENSGSEIILTRSQSCGTTIKTQLIQETCPYRGLEFFDEAHADYFFGREDLTDQLIEKLKHRNFVAVVGASGSGKSSLIRAGLIYRLRQGQKFSGSDRWRIQLITPTDQPLRSLSTAFVNSKASTIDRAEHLKRAELLLREGENGLSHLVRASLISSKQGRNSRLLLVIDQFEEVFTLCHGPQAERDRLRFFNLLITALKEVGDCLSIVLVVRADFFSKCSFYNGLAELIEQNLVTVTPLTYQQIKASIVKPAEKAGLVCEPNLAYNILLDVVGAPSELPLLQYTLLELWHQRQPNSQGGGDRLTLDAYNQLGGVRGTLQKRADEVFYSLSLEERQVAKRIFIALTQFGDGTEDTRRRILKTELVSPRVSVELVDRVIEKLVYAKLIVTNQVTVTHRYPDATDQGLANVSTALRFAQILGNKGPQKSLSQSVSQLIGHFSVARSKEYRLGWTGRAQLAYQNVNAQIAIPYTAIPYQETIDVAHEALIRSWSSLRTWLDENREMLRRQRRIEHAAREWDHAAQPRSAGYLLYGNRLVDAEEFLHAYPVELSALAQRYIAVSQEESLRAQRQLRLVQLSVPCTLLVALVVTLSQYWAVLQTQAEKEYQLQVATSRQQAAIAQSILQEPNSDSTTALLISRVAAEQGGRTDEAQASLRSALQKLQLQADLKGHQGAIHQVAFNPNNRQVATAGEDGTIRLWSLETYALEQVLHWTEEPQPKHDSISSSPSSLSSPPSPPSPSSPPSLAAIASLAFSPDGKFLAAIAQGATQVHVWSTETGTLRLRLKSFTQPVTQIAFSPKQTWLAVVNADHQVRIWNTQTGQLQSEIQPSGGLAKPVQGKLTALQFSADGNWLLTASDKLVQLWQASTGRLNKTLQHPAVVSSATFHRVSQRIVTASQDGIVRLWQQQSGHLSQAFSYRTSTEIQHQQFNSLRNRGSASEQVILSPDGQFLANLDGDRQVWLWLVASGQRISRLELQQEHPWEPLIAEKAIAFSPDSQRIVTTSHRFGENGPIYLAHVWNVRTGTMIGQLHGHRDPIRSVAFSPDSSLVATASADATARLWTAEPGSEFPTLKMADRPIQWAAFQDTVVTIASDGKLQRWNLFQGKLEDNQQQDSVAPLKMARSQSASTPFKSIRQNLLNQLSKPIWPLGRESPASSRFDSASPQSSLQPTASPEPSNALLPESATAGVGSASLRQLLPADARLTSVGFSQTARLLATADSTGTVNLWRVEPDWTLRWMHRLSTALPQSTNSRETPSPAKSNMMQHLAWSSDSRLLLGVGIDRAIYVWDVRSGKLVSQLQGHEAAISQAQFSPDGQLIVSASQDRTVRIWQVSSGKTLGSFQHEGVVNSAYFSPDGQLIVTASSDGMARVLNAVNGELRVILAGHRGALLDARFSPDGQLIVTASSDGTARVWDAHTGTEKAFLRPAALVGKDVPIRQAFFSPDGQYIAALSQNGRLHLWAATWEGLLRLARDRSLRQLQPEECLQYLRLTPNACPVLEM